MGTEWEGYKKLTVSTLNVSVLSVYIAPDNKYICSVLIFRYPLKYLVDNNNYLNYITINMFVMYTHNISIFTYSRYNRHSPKPLECVC